MSFALSKRGDVRKTRLGIRLAAAVTVLATVTK
jgi:hypothetical protein